jgi:hypothetical protein
VKASHVSFIETGRRAAGLMSARCRSNLEYDCCSTVVEMCAQTVVTELIISRTTSWASLSLRMREARVTQAVIGRPLQKFDPNNDQGLLTTDTERFSQQ